MFACVCDRKQPPRLLFSAQQTMLNKIKTPRRQGRGGCSDAECPVPKDFRHQQKNWNAILHHTGFVIELFFEKNYSPLARAMFLDTVEIMRAMSVLRTQEITTSSPETPAVLMRSLPKKMPRSPRMELILP